MESKQNNRGLPMSKNFVITVVSIDRVGIISGLSEAVVELDGNIDALSQTVVRGYFTVIVTARFDKDMDPETVRKAVGGKGAPGELSVVVRERDFSAGRPVVKDAETFILTITGPDRKGIIHRITSHLATRGINIADLYATVEGEGFLLIAQLEVPVGLEIERMQMDVQDLWPEGDVRVSLQHQNIFLATSHVDFRQTSSRKR